MRAVQRPVGWPVPHPLGFGQARRSAWRRQARPV